MLHLLLGRSGFGKTHTVLARLEELARTEEPGLLVLLAVSYTHLGFCVDS